MSQFIPKPEDTQEESLQPVFERNKSFLKSKKDSLELFLKENVQVTGFWQSLSNWFSGHKVLAVSGFASTVVVTGLIATIIFGLYNKTGGGNNLLGGIQASAEELNITPTNQDNSGVDPKSEYILESKKDLTMEEVRRNLTVEPNVNYTLDKLSDSKYKIKLAKDIGSNQIYKFKLNTITDSKNENAAKTLSWAFQAKSEFNIVQNLPKDKSINVPVDTGIEITLSQENYVDPQLFFDISPKVEGKLERKGKTIVFVPKSLQKATVYNISLKKGFGIDGSDNKLDKDFVFAFETASDEKFNQITFDKQFYEVKPGDKPSFSLFSTQNNGIASKVRFDILKYPSYEAFIADYKSILPTNTWSNYNKNNLNIDSSKLSKSDSADISKVPESYTSIFIFPKPQETGFYLVEATSGNQKIQALMQVTNIATYIQQSTNKTLAWVLDLSTQNIISGAVVRFSDSEKTASTNGQGIAVLDIQSNSEKQSSFIEITKDSQKLLVPIVFSLNDYGRYSYAGNYNMSQDYWSYLYTDRPIYKPTDTIKLWGFVQNRADLNSIPKLKANLYTYSVSNSNKIDVGKADLNLQNGSFIDQFKLDNVSTGIYYLDILDEKDKVLKSTYFNVETYQKPIYKIEIDSDKKIYSAGETAIIKGKVSFYDNAPVSGLSLKYSGSNSGEMVTDKNGQFVVKYPIQKSEYPNITNTGPSIKSLNISTKNSEEGEINQDVSLNYFDYKSALDVKVNYTEGQGKVDFQFNTIDFKKMNESSGINNTAILGSPVADKPIQINVEEVVYDKVESGKNYNYITKQVDTNYNYQERVSSVKNYNLKTDKNGKNGLSFPAKKDTYYRIQISTSDIDGVSMSTTASLYSSFGNQSGYQGYMLKNKDEDDRNEKNTPLVYKQNDTAHLTVYNGSKEAASGSRNLYLFTVNQNGLQTYFVEDKPNLNFNFDQKYAPNVDIQSIVFDGKNIFWAGGNNLKFDSSQKKLNIALTPDKTSYKPKEIVNLKAKITDKDGKPVKANLNVSVVDESIFSLSQQPLNTLDDLYSFVGSGMNTVYISHRIDLGAGGRGAGGGDKRFNFADTAYFVNIQSDENGEAQTSFKLPDNLTSWRVTSQAISQDLFAGSSSVNIAVSQPYFVDLVTSENYLQSDKPSLKIRSFGTSIKDGKDVEYTVNIYTLGVENKVLKGKSGQDVFLDLDNLKSGKHKIEIKGKFGDFEDTIIREFNVSPSFSVTTATKFYKYQQGGEIVGSASGPTILTFTDQGRGKYYQKLIDLNNNYGNRLENILAKNLAGNTLKSTFNTDLIEPKEDYQTFQTQQGGLSILPYGDNDLDLSLQVSSITNTGFNTTSLKSYLNSIINSSKESRERKIQALYALSSLGEPVLNNINTLLKTTDLTPKEQLYLSLASIKVGNTESARVLYKKLMEQYRKKDGELISFNLGNSPEEVSLNTMLVAQVAAGLNESESDNLYDFVQLNYPKENLIYLQEIGFINTRISQKNGKEISFNYSLGSQKYDKKLGKGEVFSLQVSPNELKNLNVSVNSGDLGIVSQYQQILDNNSLNKNSDVSVSRSYSVNGKKATSFGENDVVKVTLNYELKQPLDGCYIVTDYLPSGMKPLSKSLDPALQNKELWYPNQIDKQAVSFCVTKDSKSPIVYYTRVTNKGQFLADRPTIQSVKNKNILNFGESVQVKIT